jgi:anti-sigma factor RsiW
MNDQALSSDHLSPRVVAAYVDRTLDAEARRAADQHLAGCGQCRQEIAEVTSLVRRSAKVPRWYVLGPAVAAAAALIALAVLPSDSDRVGTPRLRTGASEGVPHVTAVAPEIGDTVVAAGMRLVWRHLAPDARYQISLAAADGAEVWRTTTADTSVVLPDDISLLPGQTYFWYVDALLPDGSSATTGIRRFTVGP